MARALHFGLPLINDDSKRVKRRLGGKSLFDVECCNELIYRDRIDKRDKE